MMRKYAMVIDDVTAHVNPKHLYDETMCHSAKIGVKKRQISISALNSVCKSY
jgi:hypothetical protein